MALSFATPAAALAYLAPRPRYTSAGIRAAALALGLPSFRLDDRGCYGWHVWNVKGYPMPYATLADVAASLVAAPAALAPLAPSLGPWRKGVRVVDLPGVESLHKEDGLWVCHLRWGWTTAALGGGGTVIDASLQTVRAFVKGAYQLPPVPAPGPILPGETLAPAALAPLAPAPALQTGPRTRKTGPLGLPLAAAGLLQRFGLSLASILTMGENSPKLVKGNKQASAVILHHLPARSLAAAVYGPEAGPTAPRSRLNGLAELARLNSIEAAIKRHNGCNWASKGCENGCLVWSGHGGISTAVASCRARRTMAYIYSPEDYALCVLWALGRAYAAAQRKAKPLALAYRLRGTDDLPWHEIRFNLSHANCAVFARRFGLPLIPGQGVTIPEALQLAAPGTLKPYEYSKAPVNGPLGLLAQRARGIDTTASLAADRPGGCTAALEAIAHGFRLAIPIAIAKGQPLPLIVKLRASEDGPIIKLQAINGDASDHRWLDPQGPQPGGLDGVAVILRTKISQGRGAQSAAFSLQPVWGEWQPLAGGGQAWIGGQAC